ncbi:MAG TPA: AarF/ABC1/UbiB kinase family protein [Chloroflexota bacterium]|nr:AarF/ABC1/UbiB kinase family protein [Chloroflexota bacterium]
MSFSAPRTFPKQRFTRYASRYRQIAEAFARHGMAYLLSVLGLERFVSFPRRLFGRQQHHIPYTRPERVRLVLEELGTTFIKLGQILSTRADLLPPEYQQELAKLQDSAPPVPFEEVEQVVVAELGQPLDRLFQAFAEIPLAAASIGQVHAATLLDGTEVVVKVQRPGVLEQVEEDLGILQNLARAAERRWDLADQYDLVGLAEEFARTLRSELDYVHEGQNAERFRSNFSKNPMVRVPRVYWHLTTPRILTLERMRGIKINDLDALDAAGINRTKLAEQASQILLKMIFEDGYYHADPHPGNFFVESSSRIGLVDFGMVGILDEHSQDELAALLFAVTTHNTDRVVETLIELGVARERIDRFHLRSDLDHLIARYYDRPLGEISFAALLTDALALIREHRLGLPAHLALLVKTLIVGEGLARQLDPSFNLTTVLVPYAQGLILRQFSPLRWARRLGAASLDAALLGVELPQQLRQIFGDLERGGFEVGMRPMGFEPLIQRFERLANRIVLGIIAAAFVNGLAVLVSTYRPPGFERWAGIIFASGFLAASMLGAYLAWSIVRSRGR